MFRKANRHDAARPAGRLALLAGLLSTMVAVPALASAGPAAASGPSAIVDSGSDWTVSQVPGGYEVDVTLTSPLPTRDDVPMLVADGNVLGPATESSDGLTLSLTTTDSAVAAASDVLAEWSSGDPVSTEAPAAGPAAAPAVRAPIQAAPTGAGDRADHHSHRQSHPDQRPDDSRRLLVPGSRLQLRCPGAGSVRHRWRPG